MMQQHDDMLELAALYALGALPPDEARDAAAHILQCAQCRAEYNNATLAVFGLAASAAQRPAPALRAKILAKISPAAGKRAAPAPPRPSMWQSPAWMLVAAAAVVVVFVATWYGQIMNQRTQVARMESHPSWTIACAATPCPFSGRVVRLSGRLMRLEAHGLRPLPANKVYQAWYIPKGAKPVPAPTFTATASGDAAVAIAAAARKGMLVAVTIEPKGGSKQPTTKPFLVAAIN
jgi:anti-sigma-K factor RskA